MASPNSFANDPAQLRQRAQDARRDADHAIDPDTRKTLQGIAEAFEQLAILADARRASKPAAV